MSRTPACPDVQHAADLCAQEVYRSIGKRDITKVIAEAILADRASRALPSTALAARPEEGWQIKPLEWKERSWAPVKWAASSVCGDYFARDDGRIGWCRLLEPFHAATSIEAAKAAAQADYEARVRSAFAAPSTPPTAADGHD